MWKYDLKLIGGRIRTARMAADLTIEALAEKIGKSPKHLGEVERGHSGMSIETLVNLCLELNINLTEILLDQYTVHEEDVQRLTVTLRNCPAEKRAIIQGLLDGIAKLAQEP